MNPGHIEPPEQDIEVSCFDTQISQVLLNLLSNSYDAVLKIDKRWIKITWFIDKDWIKIIVQDSGQGPDPQYSEKILHPFFTTKNIGEGTGLGLSIAKGIMKQHGGDLFFDKDKPNTTFVITFPKQLPVGLINKI